MVRTVHPILPPPVASVRQGQLRAGEVEPVREVLEQTRMSGTPAEELPGHSARRGVVDADEATDESIAFRRDLGRHALDGNVDAATDRLGDPPERDAFLGCRVQRSPGSEPDRQSRAAERHPSKPPRLDDRSTRC